MCSLKVFIEKAEPFSVICKTDHLPKCRDRKYQGSQRHRRYSQVPT